MKMKKVVALLMSFMFLAGIFSFLGADTDVKGAQIEISGNFGMGFYDEEANYYCYKRLANDSTIKMYVGQGLYLEAWVDECKVTGNSKALEASVQPMKVWLYAKKSGKATLTLITEGEDDIVLQIEIVESEEILNDVTSKITMTEKSYLKMGTDGKVKEYYSLMLNNETSSPVYAAPISWEERANEPSFKLIKANKSKTIKKIVVTHDSIDEAKNYYYLSKKQVKKLKAGKTVVIETNPIQVAFKYQDLYFHTVRSLY